MVDRHRWRELYEEHRLQFMVQQFERLIGSLEKISGRRFAVAELRTLMEQVNRQEEYFEEAKQAICDAPQTPVRMQAREIPMFAPCAFCICLME